MEELIENELAATHAFLVAWFAGLSPRSEAHLATHFVGRLDPGFQLIDPSGDIIDVARLGHELFAGHGSGVGFAIEADNVRCRFADGDIIIASYHEWQRNAVRATSRDNGRIVTAVFRTDDAAANGVRWVHVHETWLPEPVVKERFG